MTYSFTQISQYLRCPRKYRYRYLDGWREKEDRASMIFGRCFENALAAYFSEEDSTAVFFKEWQEHRDTALQYAKNDCWDRLYHQGVRLLERFVQDDRVRIPCPKRNLQVKCTRSLPCGSEFVSYVDAIGELDGTKCILDWKTTASRYPEQPDGLLSLDPQLVCYSWMTGIADVSLVVFVRKTTPEIQYLKTSIDEEQRREFGELVETAVEQIEAGHFLPHSGIRFPQNGCVGCSHLGLCLGNQQLMDSKLIRRPGAMDLGDALAAVAGTNQAEDADADAEIPQTAAIKRDEAKTEVTYDGSPQFEQIPSTQVQYAVNTSSSVLKIGDRYYVCDNGVWFAGLTPTGPWVVADSVPDAVQTIPPSSPVYNVRYVHVYDATPQIVYVGYTPGYVGTYRYYGTVVYGTGWYYRPWIGPVYYYPRPYTWGFNVIYNPWTGGWGFALGYSTPFVNVSIGWRSSYYRYPPYWGGGGWWGPGGYRPIYRPLPGYRPPYYRPPNNVIIIRPGRPGYRPGYPGYPNRPGQPGKPGRPRPTPYTRDNIYARPGVSDRVKTDYRPKGKTPKPVTKLPNNVYTDKNGDVYRRNNTGKWDKRENGKWTKPAPANPGTQPTRPGTRPAPGTPGTKPAPTNPNTRPAPQPKPGQPSIQPVPNQPQPKPTPTNPNTRPAPQPKPGQPSIQPVPNQPQPKPKQPSTRPTRPAPEAKPTTPTNPSIQPEPNNPSTRPTQPSTRPGAKPSTPTIQPAPAPGLSRDADARNRSKTARPAPPPQRTAPPNNSRQSQPSNNSRNSSSNNQSSKSQNNKNQRHR